MSDGPDMHCSLLAAESGKSWSTWRTRCGPQKLFPLTNRMDPCVMSMHFAEALEKVVSRLIGADRSAHGKRVELRRRLFALARVPWSEAGHRFMPSMATMMEVLHHLGRAGLVVRTGRDVTAQCKQCSILIQQFE
jgi:hypothetical protein